MARKRKSAAELQRIGEEHANSVSALDALAGGFTQKTFAEPVGTDVPGLKFNVDEVLSTGDPGRQHVAYMKEPAAKERADYGFGEFIKDSVFSESVTGALMVASYEGGFRPDFSWAFPKEGSAEFKELTEGLPEQYWHVFGGAMSAEHARYLKFKVLEELDRSERMAQYGGTAGVFAANMLNPENLLIGLASGGTAWMAKGSRLARVLKAGAVAGVTNMAQELPLQFTQETRDHWDMLTAAVAGVVLGGALHSRAPRGLSERERLSAHEVARRDLDELATREAVARGLITEADARRIDLKKLESEIRTKALGERVERLRKAAGASPSRTELGNLRQQHATQRMHLDRVEAKRAEIEARMLQEDIASMGQTEALSKHRTKMRKAAAAAEHDAFASKQREVVSGLQKRLEAAEASHTARAEADAIEGGKHADTPVRELMGWLRDEHRADYTAKLEKARGDVAKALGLARRAERGTLPEASAKPAAGAPEASTGAFGSDTQSMGAAHVSDDLDTSVRDYVPGSSDIKAVQEFPKTSEGPELEVLGKRFPIPFLPRIDPAAILRGIDNEDLRGIVGLYFGDPVGRKGALNPIGASEGAARRFDTAKVKFHNAYETGFAEWLKDVKGVDTVGRYFAKRDRSMRKAWGAEVDLAVRLPDGEHSPSATKAAARIRDLYAKFGIDAKEAGLKGFEDFQPDRAYSPRVPDLMKIAHNEDRFGTPKLEQFVTAAIESAYRKAHIAISPAILKAMGKGYFETLRLRAQGVAPAHFAGIKLDDFEQIAMVLERSGIDPVARAEALTALKSKLAPTDDAEKGTVRYAKHRTLLDEQYTAKLHDNETGKMEEVSFRDLFLQTDAEQLFDNYARTMSGHIALAEHAGIRSRLDHDALKEKLVDLIPAKKERDRVAGAMEAGYRLITGTPFDRPDSPLEKVYALARRYGRFMRDYNFMRVMNQVGWAQIPDSAAYLTPTYFKYTAKYFPDVHDFMRRAQDGTLNHRLAREAEEWLATGTDYRNNALFSAYDDEALPTLSKLEHLVKAGGQMTQTVSGLRHMTDFNQRVVGMGVLNRLTHNLLGRAKDLNEARLLDLGLTPEKIAPIKAQLEKHVQWDSHKTGKLLALELDRWDDPKALRDFIGAATRESRRLVQEEDLGDVPLLMHNGLVKIVMQFRRFPTVAYAKQLQHGIVHMDGEQIARTGIQIALGSLSYTAQMYVYSLSMPDDKAAEFRAKYLTPKRIFFGGIFRAGMFSLLPQLAVSVGDGLTNNGLFGMDQARTTGLSSGIMGIPALDLAARSVAFAQDIATSASRGDREFDQQDFDNARRVLPFQNAFVVKQALDAMQTMFPEHDEDDDKDSVDWGLQH